MPIFKKIHPIVQRYLMQMPHARLERFGVGQKIDIDDPSFRLDYIYCLKGGITVELELN